MNRTRNKDAWVDAIKFGEMDDHKIELYDRKVPVYLVAIAIASKTSPESIMKIAKQLEPIKRKLMKE